MKEWLRKTIRLVAAETLERDAGIVTAVNEAIGDVYDSMAELGGSATLTFQNTAVQADGSIVQANDNTIATAAFSRDGDGNRVITETVTDTAGVLKYTKTTTISKNAATQKSEIKEVYIRE